MSGRVFLDTNVVVYLYTNDDLLKKAQALAVSGQGDVWLSICGSFILSRGSKTLPAAGG